jgi:hypothetical protein
MATLTFNADSAGVTATGMTKVGSTFVLDYDLDLTQGSGTVEKDFDTVSITPDSTTRMTGTTGTMNGASYATGKALVGDFDVSWQADTGNGNFSCVGIRVDDLNYAYVYSFNNSTARLGVWTAGVRYRSSTTVTVSNSAYFRLARTGTTFTAYAKQSIGDSWSTIDSYVSAIGDGVSVAASEYHTATPTTVDFIFTSDTADSTQGIVTIPADFGAGKAADFSTSAESLSGAVIATYQTTDDTPPTNYVPTTPENLGALIARTNTDLQLQNWKVYVDGGAGGIWNSYSVDDQTPDVTPPGVPTMSNIESVGTDPNLGFFSDWVEPVDVDFDHVKGQLNIDSVGWLDIDNTASLGGATPMRFNEALAGTQTQAAGWLYQNHYARNGYTEGTTAQTRYRSVDTVGNESAYSTSGIITLSDTATASDPPQLNRIVPTDGGFDAYFTASNELDTIYARTRRKSKSLQWTARSETFKRVGSGVISITGLTNSLEYDVAGEEYNGGCYSAFSNINTGAPDGDAYAAARYTQKIVARDGIAQGELYTALNFGERVTFTNTGEDAISIYVVVQPTTHTLGVRTGQVDKNDVIVTAPRQTNFPPDQFNPNARILLGDTSYQVLTVEGDGITDLYSGVFTMTCSVFSEFDGY